MKKIIVLVLLFLIFLSACVPSETPEPKKISTPNYLATEKVAATQTVLAVGKEMMRWYATAFAKRLCTAVDVKDGAVVNCTIPVAHCNYNPNVTGRPTFCNDAPYPNQKFVFVFWGRDLTELNGKCIEISGTVSTFKGVPQIEVQSSEGVAITYCEIPPTP